MNLYSETIDGSVTAVEKETPVAKEPKKKSGTKKSTKKLEQPVEVEEPVKEEVSKVESNVGPTDEEILELFEDVDTCNEPIAIEVPIEEPVEIKKPKRQPRVPKNVVPSTPTNTPEPKVEDNDEPPKWFMNYVAGMKNVQNEVAETKKTKRVLKTESQDYAKQQWKKPDVRQRVTDNVDSHLSKMYRQIFSNRQSSSERLI